MTFSQSCFNLPYLGNNIKSKKFSDAKNKILDCINSNKFGFIVDLYEKEFDYIRQVSDKLSKYEVVLFLGTGGSSLGGRTLVSYVRNFYYDVKRPRIFFIENVDSIQIEGLLESLNLKKVSCVITSKSGETIETLSQFFLIKDKFEKKKISIKNHFFIITEDKVSTLKKIQENEKITFIPHPLSIGGRFTVFSIVGLLPALLAGFNIKNFCDGGKEFIQKINDSNSFNKYFCPVFNLIELNKKKVNMSVIMPYVDALNNLSYWYRQLWAESIGKKKMGITPLNALGTVDQHSQLQLYLDGPKDKFFTIIAKDYLDSKNKLNCNYFKKNKFKILHNKSMDELLNAEMKATVETLRKKKVPIRRILLNKMDENSLGNLMMFFFLETIFGCFLINVNPFDQPAVEEGKKLTRKYLNK